MASSDTLEGDLENPGFPISRTKTNDHRNWIRVQEFETRHVLWYSKDATIIHLGIAMQQVALVPIQRQRYWSVRNVMMFKPQHKWMADEPLDRIANAPVYLGGRLCTNDIPERFIMENEFFNDNFTKLLGPAERLIETRWRRAIKPQDGERTSVRGVITDNAVKIQETSILQRRFKRLPNFYGDEGRELIRQYNMSTTVILRAYIGTGIIPRLNCEHSTNFFCVQACDVCVSLFVMEWLMFAKHMRSLEEMMCGIKAFAMQERLFEEDMHAMQHYIDELSEEGEMGVKVGTSGALVITVLDFLEDLNIYAYLTPAKCAEEGVKEDIESLFQIMDLTVDSPAAQDAEVHELADREPPTNDPDVYMENRLRAILRSDKLNAAERKTYEKRLARVEEKIMLRELEKQLDDLDDETQKEFEKRVLARYNEAWKKFAEGKEFDVDFTPLRLDDWRDRKFRRMTSSF